MQPISATAARARFYRLIDETAESHEPILIIGQHNNAVLVSEEDLKARKPFICFRYPACANRFKQT